MRMDKYRKKTPALKPKQNLETSDVAMDTFNDYNLDLAIFCTEKMAKRNNDDNQAWKTFEIAS